MKLTHIFRDVNKTVSQIAAIGLVSICAMCMLIPSSTEAETVEPYVIKTVSIEGKAHRVVLKENLLYVLSYTNPAGLRIYDVSNPVDPVFMGAINTSCVGIDMDVVGNYAYIASHSCGLYIIDVSNPANPTLVASHSGPGNYYSVTANETNAFVTYCHNGFLSIDVTDPYNPWGNNPITTSYCGFGSTINDNYVYALIGMSGFRIFNISDPNNPSFEGEYTEGEYGYGIYYDNDRIYFADGYYLGQEYGFKIVDVSNPTNPVFVGGAETPDQELNIATNGNYAYVSCTDGNLRIFDISDETNPIEAISVNLTDEDLRNFVLNEQHAYITASYDGFLIVDLGSYSGEEPINVSLDIKPSSCPNPINTKSKGVTSVAICGDQDINVTEIDTASIRLEGVAPLRSNIEDVATPFEPYTGKEFSDDCNEYGADGFDDLVLKFNTQEIVEAIGDVEDGDVLILTVSGELSDGAGIEGEDVVVIKKKGKK
jgi:hypothetical protein